MNENEALHLLPEFAVGSAGLEAAFGAAYFGVAIVAAFLVYFIVSKVVRRATGKTSTTLDDLIVSAIGRPVFLFVVVFGPYIGLTATTFLDAHQEVIDRGLLSALIFVVGYLLKRLVDAVIIWYGKEIAGKTAATWDDRVLPLVQRVSSVVIYGLVVMLVLQSQGLNVSPLIAGLGIGGLAVALAIQPTLANFVAGTYTVTESGIGVGDYIEMESGASGWVEHVGWRTTKIRTFWNNLMIIPNGKLSESLVTNYQGPDPSVYAIVKGGVSYESDLQHVNDVTLEVVNDVLSRTDRADMSYTPAVRFSNFGDSNIDFSIIYKVKGFVDQYALKDQIIRGVHRRFREEGIEINYPVRKLVYPSEVSGSEGEGGPPINGA